MSGVDAAVADAFRDEWGRVVATLIRVTGDWDLAEECAQDAFATAIERWPREGVPRNPGAWLTTTARNRAVDRMRRATTGTAKLQEAAGYSATQGADLMRQNLCAEAIRLARTLATLMPDEPEALGLLALMLLHHARRAARVDSAGDLIALEDQDRSAWDAATIAESVDIL